MSERAKAKIPFDGVTVLSIYVFFLLAIPSNYIVGPIGSAGSLASLTGMGMLLWWVARRLARPMPTSNVGQPVRKATILFIAAVLASYVAAMIRPIEGVELNAADRGLMIVASWLGVILITGDEIPSSARFETLLRRVSLGGGLVAALGIAQFATGLPFTNYLKLPGLTVNSELSSVIARAGYVRPAGTAIHPIEFGVTISMLLPLALHFSLSSKSASAFRRWFPVFAIGIAIPLSISRSAIICTAVSLIFIIPALEQRVRMAVAVTAMFIMMIVYVTVPGILGTIIGLFTGLGQDDSVGSRTDSYSLASQFISHAPLFGRGFYTFLPDYRILDNQFLGSIIELGIIGLLAMIGLFLTGILLALRTKQRVRDPETRRLCQALAASLASGVVSFAFFDAFSFPMVASLVFLMLGAIGSQHRLVTTEQSAARLLLGPETKTNIPIYGN